MLVIVSKEILENEIDAKEKIELFFKDNIVPTKWAVNVVDGKYVFEYLDSEKINLFGELNEGYLEMII